MVRQPIVSAPIRLAGGGTLLVMAVIARYDDEASARRSLSWLQRWHVRGAAVHTADGHLVVEVPDAAAPRALDLLATLDRLSLGTAPMGRRPLRERFLSVESLGLVAAVVFVGGVAVGGVIAAFLYVRTLGVIGAIVVAAGGLVWVWFNGFSAANPDPDALEHHHGPVTQELGVTHAYRRAWVKHTWRSARSSRRRRLLEDPGEDTSEGP
jgi:hypothetical protein